MTDHTRLHTKPFDIRLSTPEDYPALAAIKSVMVPDRPTTAEEYLHEDDIRDPRIRHRRWVVEVEGRVVGEAYYTQLATLYHPCKFVIGGWVLPEFQRRGIGTALYHMITQALQPYDPIYYHVFARGTHPEGIAFLAHRGFTEVFRERVSILDVYAFDSGPYSGLEGKLLAQGIVIHTLAELRTDPDHTHKLYDLDWQVFNDIPDLTEPPVRMPYDTWLKETIEHPQIVPDAFFVAVKGCEYVGLSYLYVATGKSSMIYSGLAGVRRGLRRQGIALAMKVRGIAYARQRGYTTLWTSNAVHNQPILALNERLGFVRQYETVEMMKRLREEQ